jgi:RsiW-degrading membrane proteinase PrsW (M82 family)
MADVRKNIWIQILLTGIFLYLLSLMILILTGNSILFPTVVMLGSFMVPVTYVGFFYERGYISKVKLSTIVLGFVYGGTLGVLIASFFEPLFIRRLDFLTAFSAGAIEEAAKIIAVILIIRKSIHTNRMNGIIIGAAVGMGFAALESMGYSFTAFLRTSGNLTDTVFITLLRALLSPLGHGTWTAILAGELFAASDKHKFIINRSVVLTYLAVTGLHGLWDGLPSLFSEFVLPGLDFFLSEFIVAAIGIGILIKSWRSVKKIT